MALFNSFQFGDVDSKDYGVYISGDSVYDSPARSVDLVQVPGRNGALALDNGYYENIEVTYPAGSFGTSQEEWREKMLGIRNALAAQRGYQRLIDTYHPEHYRLGMFFAGISASPVQYNRAGQFPIRFNCKPQRFLISGDEAVEFTAEGQEEVYGPSSIASFEAEEGAEIRQLEVDLEPVQDLNGYDSPWPAGGGKNILPHSGSTTTIDGITFTMNADGTVTASGTATANAIFTYNNKDFATPPAAGTYYFNGNPTGASGSTYRMRTRQYVNGSWTSWLYTNDRSDRTLTFAEGTTRMQVDIYIMSGQTVSNLVFKPMLRSTSYTDSTYTPYSNICPISGHTEVNVYRTGKNLFNGENTILDRYLDADGSLRGSNGWSLSGYIAVPSDTTMHFNPNSTEGSAAKTWFYNESKERISYISSGEQTFTTPSNCKYMRFSFRSTSTDIQLELGSTATDYEPYTDTTYPISLGQTVYGGTLNVSTGVLTINAEARTILGSNVVATNNPTGYAMISLGAFGYVDGSYAARSNMFVNWPGLADTMPAYHFKCLNSSGYNRAQLIFNCDFESSTNAEQKQKYVDFLNKMNEAGTPLVVVYGLATPLTYQLSPSQVSTLLGQNNIWADAGTVEVKVASPVDLTNPTNFPAKPLIRVYGNGTVRMGDTIATVSNNEDGYVDIDCESMNCYDTTGGRNADVSFSSNDFPELASGNNSILLTGPSKVEITPRWWEL